MLSQGARSSVGPPLATLAEWLSGPFQDDELKKELQTSDGRHLFLTVMRGQLNQLLLSQLPEGTVSYGKKLESKLYGIACLAFLLMHMLIKIASVVNSYFNSTVIPIGQA